MYLVSQRFYKHKSYPYNGARFINTFRSLENAIDACELLLETAFFAKNGTTELPIYHTIKNLNDITRIANKTKNGSYFITKNPDVYLQYELNCKRKIPGIIYNDYEIEKVFTLDIIKTKFAVSERKQEKIEFDYFEEYEELMSELKVKFGEIEEKEISAITYKEKKEQEQKVLSKET